jgi:rhodanese-related sulfurtransferase
MAVKADVKLDAKGLACPMPIVKTKKAMNDLEEGQILEVQATDKGSKADLAAWSQTVGHQYIGTTEDGDVLYHYIRKCADDTMIEKTHEQTIANEEIVSRAANGGYILDVREEAEYAFGHIEGAKSIPMGELESRMNELNKNQEIYVICRTGKRSDLASQKLAIHGFKNVYNVLPGMTGWSGSLTKSI